jgi:UDP-N-acetylmuramoylalanine-D-glutamate ligase
VDALDRDRTVGITGSAGKSSTSGMIAAILDEPPGTAALGGNIGGSLLGSAWTDARHAVLELSSAMLWWLGEGSALAGLEPWSPAVAVLTNLAPNHVDWHGTLGHYALSKAAIRAAQRPGDAFVTLYDLEQPAAAADIARACGRAWWAGTQRPGSAELDALLAAIELPEVPGEHQRRNARLAVLGPRRRSGARAGRRTARRSSGGCPASARCPTGCSTWARGGACAATTTRRAPPRTPRCWRSGRSRIRRGCT